MSIITTKAPLPVDTAALKQYRVSSRGGWMPTQAENDPLRVMPEAGWYLFEWHATVEFVSGNTNALVMITGGGLRSQKDVNSDGSAVSHSSSYTGTSISFQSNNSTTTAYDRAVQGSLVMFLDGTPIEIEAIGESSLSHTNQFVFTRFAFPNGNDLGA